MSEYIPVNDISGKVTKPEKPFLVDPSGYKIVLPHPPNKKCKKCYGRGYLGTNSIDNTLVICHKCFRPKQ